MSNIIELHVLKGSSWQKYIINDCSVLKLNKCICQEQVFKL